MAQHVVILLNQTVPQLQEVQLGDSYLMPADVEIQGDLTISGTVDGQDIAAVGVLAASALQSGDNISTLVNDAGYTNDQTGTEIKAAYEAEPNTNVFTDAEQTKLAGIAAGAQVNPLFASQAEAENGTENTKIMTALHVAQAIAVFSSGLLNNYNGTTAPGPTNDVNDGYSVGSIWMWQTVSPQEVYRCIDNTAGVAIWIKTSLTIDELATVALSGNSDSLVEGVVQLLMTVAERSKLVGIEPFATADQTGAEIKVLYEAEANTNAFTDTHKDNLDALTSLTVAITAFTGGGQASATPLTTRYNIVETVASAGDSVKLPAAVGGKVVVVKNISATSCDVFPITGGKINNYPINNAEALAAGVAKYFFATSATQWETL